MTANSFSLCKQLVEKSVVILVLQSVTLNFSNCGLKQSGHSTESDFANQINLLSLVTQLIDHQYFV